MLSMEVGKGPSLVGKAQVRFRGVSIRVGFFAICSDSSLREEVLRNGLPELRVPGTQAVASSDTRLALPRRIPGVSLPTVWPPFSPASLHLVLAEVALRGCEV